MPTGASSNGSNSNDKIVEPSTIALAPVPAPTTATVTRPVAVLRSCCNSCADAKIGCTKEKPTCQRCAKRNEPCVYAVTKRAGRPLQSGRRAAVANRGGGSSSSSSSSDAPFTLTTTPPPSTSVSTPSFPRSAPLHTSLDPAAAAFADVFPAFDDDMNFSASLASTDLSELNDDFGDFLAVNSLYSMPKQTPSASMSSHLLDRDNLFSAEEISVGAPNEISDPDAMHVDQFFGNESTSMPFSADLPNTLPNIDTPSRTTRLSTSNLSNVADAAMNLAYMGEASSFGSGEMPSVTPCSCLASCLGLLSQTTPPFLDNNVTEPGSVDHQPPTFQNVMLQNKAAIEIVGGVLNCHGTHQDSILLILSIVVLQTMGWYAAAVCSNVTKSHNGNDDIFSMKNSRRSIQQVVQPPSAGAYPYEDGGENLDQIVCHLVLSEIHHVQRVVNLLSKQLLAAERRTRQARPVGVGSHAASTAQDLLFNGLFFNSSTSVGLGQGLVADLKSRVRELSRGIINTLAER